MKSYPEPLDLRKVRVYPLATRKSLSSIEGLLADPDAAPAEAPGEIVQECAHRVRQARERGASVMLLYGAHLLKNGAHRMVNALIRRGWVTHLGTNGAGTIHDWELAFLGRTEESVRANVAAGCFGTWDETGLNIHTALLAGGLRHEGYGRSLGRFIEEDGVEIPTVEALTEEIRRAPDGPAAPAQAELLQAIRGGWIHPGRITVKHPWKEHSVVAEAYRNRVPLTVHPGIGYDIIATHPVFSGAAIGRAAACDFRLFAAAVEQLDGGVVLSVGSAIMAPQVFEKSLSCVNNLRLQAGRPVVSGHSIYVVDIQDGGNWDWSRGEPPKANPAYYLRFCKSYARMGGAMQYVQMDNVRFVHQLLHLLG